MDSVANELEDVKGVGLLNHQEVKATQYCVPAYPEPQPYYAQPYQEPKQYPLQSYPEPHQSAYQPRYVQPHPEAVYQSQLSYVCLAPPV